MREGGRESDGRLAGAADAAVALLSQSVSRTLTTHTFATFASRGEQKSLRQVTIISKRPPEVGPHRTRSLALHFIARSQPRGAEPSPDRLPGHDSTFSLAPGLALYVCRL